MVDYEVFELGDVQLRLGATLRDAKLAYKTYGTLDQDKNNAIVYPTWYSGQHYDNEWLVGPGMALDPATQFVIIPDMLGNGLSSSPSNTPEPCNGPRFPNVTAAEAHASIDVRATTMADSARLEARLHGLRPQTPGTSLELTGGFDRPPLERTDGVIRLYNVARGVAGLLGRDLPEGAAGGGSDGNFTAALGVSTLDGLGPAGGGAHALDEHVLLSDLSFRAALLAGMLSSLSEGLI